MHKPVYGSPGQWVGEDRRFQPVGLYGWLSLENRGKFSLNFLKLKDLPCDLVRRGNANPRLLNGLENGRLPLRDAAGDGKPHGSGVSRNGAKPRSSLLPLAR